jgi:hypothetical protein
MSKQLPMLMRRRGSALVPVDAWSEERLRQIPEAKDLNVTAPEARGDKSTRARLNGWYWAGLNLMLENVDETKWPTARKLHKLILEELGYTTRFYRIDGSYKDEVDSTKFDEMPDDEFTVYFERARVWVDTNFGTDYWDEWKKQKDGGVR